MWIRQEKPTDIAAVRAVHLAAFDTPAEAVLVDRLRGRSHPYVSLVADDKGRILGHLLLTPALLPGHPRARLLGLAPMAVLPQAQRSGIGSALVAEGLRAARELGAGAVVVVGSPEYFPRFGFVRASRFGLVCGFAAVPDEAFMIVELQPGHLAGLAGTVEYHKSFTEE